MHWEVWEYKIRSLVATTATEDAALDVVRDLLRSGWAADDLSMGLEDETRAPEDLPPPIEGIELSSRAFPTGTERSVRAS